MWERKIRTGNHDGGHEAPRSRAHPDTGPPPSFLRGVARTRESWTSLRVWRARPEGGPRPRPGLATRAPPSVLPRAVFGHSLLGPVSEAVATRASADMSPLNKAPRLAFYLQGASQSIFEVGLSRFSRGGKDMDESFSRGGRSS